MTLRCAALLIAAVLIAHPSVAAAQDQEDEHPPSGAGDEAEESEPFLRGGYFGTAAGLVTVTSAAARRDAIGSGLKVDFTLGTALWDQLAVNIGVGFIELSDEMPFEQWVQRCAISGGGGCEDPTSEESVASTFFALFEAGYQRRFAPVSGLTLLPGILLGYLLPTEPLSRGLRCSGCASYEIPAFDASGIYLSPFFRTTVLRWMAASVRWQWFMTSEFEHAILFGIEFGTP